MFGASQFLIQLNHNDIFSASSEPNARACLAKFV